MLHLHLQRDMKLQLVYVASSDVEVDEVLCTMIAREESVDDWRCFCFGGRR